MRDAWRYELARAIGGALVALLSCAPAAAQPPVPRPGPDAATDERAADDGAADDDAADDDAADDDAADDDAADDDAADDDAADDGGAEGSAADDGAAEALEEPDTEPQASGELDYEPDQRGYEPDQRGGHERPEEASGAGGVDYEPDQRGAAEPAPVREGEDVELRTQAASAPATSIGLDLRLDFGAGATLLDAFDGDNLIRGGAGGSFGASFGVTLGLRLGPLTLGPRHGLVFGEGPTLATFGLDALLHLLDQDLAPYLRATVSYVHAFGFPDALEAEGPADGFLGELGVGVRLRLGGGFLLGGEISAGYLGLFRGGAPGCAGVCAAPGLDLRLDGRAHGLLLRGLLSFGYAL